MPATTLSPKRRRFVVEYLVDLNGTQAAIRAGFSARSARKTAYKLLATSPVQLAVRTAMAQRSVRTEITIDNVLQEFWAIATTDANEIIEFRRTCCRHCYGEGHEYQLTQRELDKREAEWAKRKNSKPTDVFDPLGGPGFDARHVPNEDCPECFGEGHGREHVKDTRALSPGARRLYAGVKRTKDGGLEIKLHDKLTALTKVGEHLGMFTGARDAPISDEARIRLMREQLAAMDAMSAPPPDPAVAV